MYKITEQQIKQIANYITEDINIFNDELTPEQQQQQQQQQQERQRKIQQYLDNARNSFQRYPIGQILANDAFDRIIKAANKDNQAFIEALTTTFTTTNQEYAESRIRLTDGTETSLGECWRDTVHPIITEAIQNISLTEGTWAGFFTTVIQWLSRAARGIGAGIGKTARGIATAAGAGFALGAARVGSHGTGYDYGRYGGYERSDTPNQAKSKNMLANAQIADTIIGNQQIKQLANNYTVIYNIHINSSFPAGAEILDISDQQQKSLGL
jgi:hypothetical protein